MASPVAPELLSKEPPALRTGNNRLASTCFRLAFAALAAAFLSFVLLALVSALPLPVVLVAAVVVVGLYVGGPLSSVAAMVTGVLALLRARRSAPPQQQRGRAIAGLVLGIVLLVLLVFPGGFFFLLSYSCAVNHMCV